MGQIVWLVFLFLFVPRVLFAEVSADGNEETKKDVSTELIDQRVRSSFTPGTAFLFSSQVNGSVRNQSASVVPSLAGPGEYTVGTLIPQGESKNMVFYTFFLRGRDASFAATPVRKIDAKVVDTRTRTDLERRAADLSESQLRTEKEVKELRGKLQNQRDQARKLTGVDDLMELQTELNRLVTAEERKASEQVRLSSLIDAGRRLADPEGIDLVRQQLSVGLRDTAQATALSDRLKVRKIAAARDIVSEKLVLVKATSKYNREDIAKEILALRATRRKLELRVGRRSSEEREDDN